MKNLKLILFLNLLPFFAIAQKIENVDFKVNDNIVIISYDLVECPENYFYDIKVKFKSEAGTYIYPKNAYGDVKGVSQGYYKSISWNVLTDGQELKGNVSVIVEIDNSHYNKPHHQKLAHGKIRGGPSNAFLSMLLPGLGDIFVDKYANDNTNSKKNYSYNSYGRSNTKRVWYLVPLTYYLCAYGAYGEYVNYQKYYAGYHNSNVQITMDKYYNDASVSYTNSQIYLGIAASAWLTDVIHVAAKGFKNRKRQINGYSFVEPRANYYVIGTRRNFQFGLTYKL